MLQAIKVKERIPIPRNLITVMAVLFGVQGMNAQCAMCRAVVEQGGEEMAEGINSGIVYLMAFPYLVVAVSMFLFYRNWKKTATAR